MGNSISKYRRLRKIKQNDMAKAMGVTPSYLCKIEKDSIEASESFKKSCAEYLDVDLNILFSPSKKLVVDSDSNMIWNERIKKGITQRELAVMLKCSPSYLSKIEKGEIDPPFEFKKECAKIFRKKADKLFPGFDGVLG
ncbi:MAG: helix-turn-helix transcriptional regulator [Spirochaetes bacterium]|nr:helix-turn-helix transcriptional regulator [Spirochaetota bacterium]